MKRLTAITALCLLFSTAFVAGKGTPEAPRWPDSLPSVYLYTEGIKQMTIARDSTRARELFSEAIRRDSTFAPAWYELGTNGMYESAAEAVELARTAYRLDTANRWYHQFYGQSLILAGRYKQARDVYRRLQAQYPQDPDNYRLLAALYEQTDDPYMALATLDSAEMRFGRIPYLSNMKRRLLIATQQTDLAVEEAKALVDEAPYEQERLVVLGELYGLAGKDSLARGTYARALAIDSTNVAALMSFSDYLSSRQDYRELLAATKRIFEQDAVPLETKIRRFEQFTADVRFYRQFYPQLDDLASTLAIRYPGDKRVVELYAGHLIASGELERALALYKLHLGDQPPVEEYYHAVIDIESYLQRPDSAARYIALALERFPEKVGFHLARGNSYVRAKENDRAIRAYRESLRYADTDSLRSVIWGMIGDTWHQKAEAALPDASESPEQHLAKLPRKAMKQCFAAYDRSLRYWKDNALVLNNYAYFLAVGGRDLVRALEMSSRVISLTDNNPTYLDTHAWVLYKLGRYDEAKKAIQQAVAFDRQESPELLLHYGDILHALGERFSAEVYWRKALEKGYDADAIGRRLQKRNPTEQGSAGKEKRPK